MLFGHHKKNKNANSVAMSSWHFANFISNREHLSAVMKKIRLYLLLLLEQVAYFGKKQFFLRWSRFWFWLWFCRNFFLLFKI